MAVAKFFKNIKTLRFYLTSDVTSKYLNRTIITFFLELNANLKF